MNEKPEWMLYAAEIQKRIDAMPYNKGFEKRRDETVHFSYLTAIDKKGYQGRYSDWDLRPLYSSCVSARHWSRNTACQSNGNELTITPLAGRMADQYTS